MRRRSGSTPSQYPVPLLVLFGVGCFGWVVAYVAIVKNALSNRFLEIPAGAVVANIAWEFVWGFLYPNELGRFFSWGYRAWFFFDLAIVYLLFRWGDQPDGLRELEAIFTPACVFGIAAWAVGIYFFVGEGYDTGYGAISGYILNTMMSALYVVIILRHGELYEFSLARRLEQDARHRAADGLQLHRAERQSLPAAPVPADAGSTCSTSGSSTLIRSGRRPRSSAAAREAR